MPIAYLVSNSHYKSGKYLKFIHPWPCSSIHCAKFESLVTNPRHCRKNSTFFNLQRWLWSADRPISDGTSLIWALSHQPSEEQRCGSADKGWSWGAQNSWSGQDFDCNLMHSKPISWCRRDALPLGNAICQLWAFHSDGDLGRILVASPSRICLAGKSLQSAAECFGGRRQEGVQSKRHNPLLLSYGRRSACIWETEVRSSSVRQIYNYWAV